MTFKMVNGMLCIVAETPKDGYELGELQRKAAAANKILAVVVSKDASVAATIRLPDAAETEERKTLQRDTVGRGSC